MGKKQHSKDRLFLTATEWATERGGFKKQSLNRAFKKLPFHCCSISLSPFDDPVCDPHGNVFDIVNLVPFMQKYKRNPVTGEKMSSKDIFKLKFHKDSAGEYCCPSTYKLFNEHTHIVTVRTTGNVYSMDAIQELCFKAGNWRDLVDDTPFKREDLITIQDPHKIEDEIGSFYHVKMGLSSATAAEQEDKSAAAGSVLNKSAVKGTLSRVLEQTSKQKTGSSFEGKAAPGINRVGSMVADKALAMVREKAEREKQAELEKAAKKAAKLAAAPPGEPEKPRPNHAYSTGAMAASFTSTGVDVVYTNEFQEYNDDEVRERIYKRVKKKCKKGYAKVRTNHGELNIELHCDMVPKTCDNWLQLAESNYYDGTKFHRLIPGFMIQGGDPTGTGSGGKSVWGKPFKDEFHPKLTHSARGVLSMANSGKNTNKSQFFFTFGECNHLDNKHSVFGRVVGQLGTLNSMERVETTGNKDNDKPKQPVNLISVQVFVNPFTDEQKAQDEEDEAARVKEEEAKKYKEELGSWFSNPAPATAAGGNQGVGKYLPQPAASDGGEPKAKRPKV